jgi:aconitase B
VILVSFFFSEEKNNHSNKHDSNQRRDRSSKVEAPLCSFCVGITKQFFSTSKIITPSGAGVVIVSNTRILFQTSNSTKIEVLVKGTNLASVKHCVGKVSTNQESAFAIDVIRTVG